MPPELLELLKAGGAALSPIMGLLWWLERQERLKEREEHKTVARDMVSSMAKTEATLSTLAGIFTSGRGAQ